MTGVNGAERGPRQNLDAVGRRLPASSGRLRFARARVLMFIDGARPREILLVNEFVV